MRAAAPLIGVIDDDVSFREALAGLVESFGFRAQAFASAEACLGSPRLPILTCLIVDVRMPGLSGLDLQRRLGQSGLRIPMIFVTSSPDDATRARALAAGAIGFLGKPFDSERLLDHVRTALACQRRPHP